jgi:Cyclic nucleotide-binding domain
MALYGRLSRWLESRRRPEDALECHGWAGEDSPPPSTGNPGTDSAAGRPEDAVSSKPRSLAPGGSFWDALDPTEREALRSVATWRTFAAGSRIMEEGERADHVIVILGGRAKVVVSDNGTERVLAVRGLGQLIGERAALDVSVRSATVIALEMVWALVVHTRDFAAFLSAHPPVRSIVESQRHYRGITEPDGHQRNDDPGGFGAGTADSTIGDADLVGRWRRRPRRLHGENCTVSLTDVVDFGARTRTDGDRRSIREALFRMARGAVRGFPDVQFEDRGDGFLTVVPPDVTTAQVISQALSEMSTALALHNSTQRESARFKLRLALNVGPVVSDVGVSGEAIIVTARLVDAPDFKNALTRSSASLGLIVSPFVYETVVRHGAYPGEAAAYSQVRVEVKESETQAWIRLVDVRTSSTYLPASPATIE